MRDLAGYLIYRVLTGIFGLFPEPVIRRVGRGLGYSLSFVAGERLAMAERHMRRALGPGVDPRPTARAMFASYGRYWAEVFWMRPRRRQAVVDHSEVIGKELVDASGEHGVILALPHLGNWEAAGTKSAAVGYPVVAVAEALRNRRIVDWFRQARQRFGIEVIIAEKGANVTRQLIGVLRRGGTVALLCDRDVKGDGVPVLFFGEETTLPAGPVALADRTGAWLLPIGSYFKEGRGHRLVVHPRLEIPDAPTREERIALGTQALAHKLEEIIRAAPEQWHIMQPNWPSDQTRAGAETAAA